MDKKKHMDQNWKFLQQAGRAHYAASRQPRQFRCQCSKVDRWGGIRTRTTLLHFSISLLDISTNKFQVEMLHRAVRNFSQDLQVKFRWMWIYCNPIYWGSRWMLAHCNSDLTVHFHHLTKGLLQLPYEQVISETIKERTVLQIKTALQKKAYEEAGIQVQNSVPTNKIMQGMLIAVTIQRRGRQRSCS